MATSTSSSALQLNPYIKALKDHQGLCGAMLMTPFLILGTPVYDGMIFFVKYIAPEKSDLPKLALAIGGIVDILLMVAIYTVAYFAERKYQRIVAQESLALVYHMRSEFRRTLGLHIGLIMACFAFMILVEKFKMPFEEAMVPRGILVILFLYLLGWSERQADSKALKAARLIERGVPHKGTKFPVMMIFYSFLSNHAAWLCLAFIAFPTEVSIQRPEKIIKLFDPAVVTLMCAAVISLNQALVGIMNYYLQAKEVASQMDSRISALLPTVRKYWYRSITSAAIGLIAVSSLLYAQKTVFADNIREIQNARFGLIAVFFVVAVLCCRGYGRTVNALHEIREPVTKEAGTNAASTVA